MPEDLKEWANRYASDNNTTFSAIVIRLFTRLKQVEDAKHVADGR